MSDEVKPESEIEALRKRATLMGIDFHPNLGATKLKGKIDAQLAKTADQIVADQLEEPMPDVSTAGLVDTPYAIEKALETPGQKRVRIRKHATRLVRFRLTCMNPNKKGWTVQQFAVGNRSVGTIKRYIPFNAPAWHCEEMLLKSIQNRKYIDFYEVKDRKGRPYKKHRLVKEFAIEILPPLTPKELTDLKAQQRARPNQLED